MNARMPTAIHNRVGSRHLAGLGAKVRGFAPLWAFYTIEP
jgi:hypothetical protein